jgi:hypothetical protein
LAGTLPVAPVGEHVLGRRRCASSARPAAGLENVCNNKQGQTTQSKEARTDSTVPVKVMHARTLNQPIKDRDEWMVWKKHVPLSVC